MWRKDHDEAIGEVEKGLVLDPNHADGHMYRAIALGFAGKTEESVRTVAKAMRLNPAAPFWYLWALGNACFSLGHYEDAVNACRKATVSNPNFLFANLCLAASYGQLGRTEEAAAAAADCQRIVSSLSLDWAGRVVPFKDATVQAGFLSGLRAAGIPD